MATISNGESGSSVRTKLNEIINKVEGVTSINNNIDVTGTITSDGLTVDGVVNIDRTSFNPASGWGASQDVSPAGLNFEDNGTTVGNLLGQTYKTDSVSWGTTRLSGFFGMEKTNAIGNGDFVWWLAPTNFAQNPAQKMRIASNGDISFYEDTGTTAKFFWDASAESLGIGTSSPSSILHTSGTDHITIQDTNNTSTNVQQHISLQRGDGSGIDGRINTVGDGSNGVSAIAFAINGERMRIDSSGRVGIGTISPSFPLDVSGSDFVGIHYERSSTSSPALRLSNATTGSLIQVEGSNAGDFIFKNGAGTLSEAMRITSNGSVGIGTSLPAGILQLKAANPDLYITSDNTGQSDIYFGGTTTPTKGRVQYSDNSDFMAFWTNSGQRMTIDSSGNLLIGGTVTPTSSAKNLVLHNGTAPTGNATDGVILYAEDVSSSSELKVRDEAGNVTTLSPHNFDLIPEGPSEDMAWSYYSERDGKRINVDMLKAIRLLEQISGEKLVHMV